MTAWQIFQSWVAEKSSQSNSQSIPVNAIAPATALRLSIAKEFSQICIETWRIMSRAEKTETPEPVKMAVARAVRTLSEIGFKIEHYVGIQYDDRMNINIVENVGGPHNRVIIKCVEPSVFFEGKLIHAGEFITEGKSQ